MKFFVVALVCFGAVISVAESKDPVRRSCSGEAPKPKEPLGTTVLFNFAEDDVDFWLERSDVQIRGGDSSSKADLVIIHNNKVRRAVFLALLNPLPEAVAMAGVRTLGTWDFTGYTKLQIRCRAQGQFNKYKFILRHKGQNFSPFNVVYQQVFEGPSKIATVELPLAAFAAESFGAPNLKAEALDLSYISAIGWQIYEDHEAKQYGPVSLEIESISLA